MEGSSPEIQRRPASDAHADALALDTTDLSVSSARHRLSHSLSVSVQSCRTLDIILKTPIDKLTHSCAACVITLYLVA